MKSPFDEPDLNTPKNASRVARRALVLAAATCRGFLESEADEPETSAVHRRVLEWLTRLGLWEEVEAEEEKWLRAPLGTLEAEEGLRASWFVEGLAVLSWSLKRFEFPGHAQQVDPHEVAESVLFLEEEAGEVIRTAELRSVEELEACRELLYAIHVRLRDFMRHRNRKDFSRWVEKDWLDVLNLEAGRLIAEGDLAIDGKPISQADDERIDECETITHERHRAIIWLVEGDESYSQTSVDT